MFASRLLKFLGAGCQLAPFDVDHFSSRGSWSDTAVNSLLLLWLGFDVWHVISDHFNARKNE